MVEKWQASMRGRERRTVYVYVPDGAPRGKRFPVLYMFDGHNVFFDKDATYGKSWGMKEFLDAHGVQIMVVAVDCDHSPRNGRLCEYSPFSWNDSHFGEVHGRGRWFMTWLTEVLKPQIDRRYPTKPQREHTMIAGSSMGGLMAIYAVTSWNRFFGRAAALSPSVWTSSRKVCRLIEESRLQGETVLYMDYGSEELSNHPGILPQLTRVAGTLAEQGIYLTARIVPHGTHCEACWEQQIPYFLQILLTPEEWGQPEEHTI